MTERDDFQRLQKEAEERKIKDAQEANKQAEAVEQAKTNRLVSDNAKTKELLTYCEQTFKGVKVPSTGHDLLVSSLDRSKVNNLNSDGVEYVAVTISHFDDDGKTRWVPFVLCRYCGGNYEFVIGLGPKERHRGDFNSFKEFLKQSVADIGQPEVTSMLKQMRAKGW
jgi:hypothetical protein